MHQRLLFYKFLIIIKSGDKMKTSRIRKQVVEEISKIPDEKLPQMLDLIHRFKRELKISPTKRNKITSYSGCWKDIPEDTYREFMEEISQRRRTAFSRRRRSAANVG